MTERTIQDVARQIRDELPQLTGDAAGDVDRALGAALDGGGADDVFAVLVAHEATRARLDELLPPELAEGERGFSPLPGHAPAPAAALMYRCPLGDYDWPAFDEAEPVPRCPRHDVALVPAE